MENYILVKQGKKMLKVDGTVDTDITHALLSIEL